MKVAMDCACCVVMMLLAMVGGSGVIGSADGKHKPLPPAMTTGKMSLEEAIAQRRSVRQFVDKALRLDAIGQLCWAGQGMTDPSRGFRASPSAGALYPIELYVVTAEGVDHYEPKSHSLARHLTGDLRPELQRAALGQEAVGRAPACVVVTAIVERSARKYGGRAERYCFMEAGHVAQNILLQATALRLVGVPIGAFEDPEVVKVLKLPPRHRIIYIVPVGHPGP